jgi:hypothetical protein
MTIFPGCKCCGPSTNCDSLCSATFSKRTNQLVDFNGPHSGGYLFQSAFPAGWPDGNVLQYNRELIVEVNNETLDEWIVESYYDTFLGVYSYGLLPTKYPRVPPVGSDILGRTRSPVRIDIFMVPGRTYEPFTNTSQCSATALFSFLDTQYDPGYGDWYSKSVPGDVNLLFNGYGGFRQKANPMVIGSVNNFYISPSEFTVGGMSETGVIGSHYFIPDVIDEATIAPNWGTVPPQPYTMISMQDWRNSNSVYCKAIRKNDGGGSPYPGEDNGPREPFVGQVYEANITWPDMLSIGKNCNPYTTRNSAMTKTKTSGGPGTELKNTLASWGIHPKKGGGCKCKDMEVKMNRLGSACKEPANLKMIVDHLQAEAKKRKLPFVRKAGELLVLRAVKRFEKES